MRFAAPGGLLVSLLGLVVVGAQAPDPARGEQGRQLFEKNRCLLCHKLGDKGGKLAGALDDIGRRRNADALKRAILEPQKEFPDAKVKMPVFKLQPAEMEALVAYLSTLKNAPR